MKRWLSLIALLFALPSLSAAQTPPSGRPTGRLSIYASMIRIQPDGTPAVVSGDVITAVQFEVPDGETDRFEYGVDMRRRSSFGSSRPARLSVYDGYVGARLAGGRARVRAGQMWIPDLGGLGSISGGLFEYRQAPSSSGGSRLRVGGFAGVEPDPYGMGHATGVTKFGTFAILEAPGGRRHTIGYVRVRHEGMTERSVLTGSNFLRAAGRVFIYQTAEYDLTGPAGQGKGGLTYMLLNAHASLNDRLDVQGLYHRGRSIDARSITDDVLNGRALQPGALDGMLFESAGGRLTARVTSTVRVNAGYTRDRNNHDSSATGRLTVGASTSNLGRTGIDISVSESRIHRPTGQYNSLYVSAGRQIGSRVYFSGDYSSSVSIARFTRSDGLTIETRPHTRQLSFSGVVTLTRSLSLLTTGEHTRDDGASDVRILSGLNIRFR